MKFWIHRPLFVFTLFIFGVACTKENPQPPAAPPMQAVAPAKSIKKNATKKRIRKKVFNQKSRFGQKKSWNFQDRNTDTPEPIERIDAARLPPLNTGLVNKAYNAMIPQFIGCFDPSSPAPPSTNVSFQVDPNGTVSDIEIEGISGDGAACLSKIVSTLSVPAFSGSSVAVSFPFVMQRTVVPGKKSAPAPVPTQRRRAQPKQPKTKLYLQP